MDTETVLLVGYIFAVSNGVIAVTGGVLFALGRIQLFHKRIDGGMARFLGGLLFAGGSVSLLLFVLKGSDMYPLWGLGGIATLLMGLLVGLFWKSATSLEQDPRVTIADFSYAPKARSAMPSTSDSSNIIPPVTSYERPEPNPTMPLTSGMINRSAVSSNQQIPIPPTPFRSSQTLATLEVEKTQLQLPPRVAIMTENFKIGRGEGNNLQLLDVTVSRFHAQIRYSQGMFFLQDKNSKTGVQVNGSPVPAARLKSGDRVTIGATTLIIRFSE